MDRIGHNQRTRMFRLCWVTDSIEKKSLVRFETAFSNVEVAQYCHRTATYRPTHSNCHCWTRVFRSTPPNKVDLKCPSARPYVRPSVRKKFFFNLNEIWCVVRGRRLMLDGMQYDPIQGHDQGHEPSKVGNLAIFKGYLLLPRL